MTKTSAPAALFFALFALTLGLAPVAARAQPTTKPVVEIVPAELPAIMATVRAPGAKVVLLNVWASWCEPCREEMPALLRYYREHKDGGLRLVLVSADAKNGKPAAEAFLAQLGVDFRSYIKLGDDMAFINALDPRWDGTIPASFAYDGNGKAFAFWPGQISYEKLARKLDPLLGPVPAKPTRRKP